MGTTFVTLGRDADGRPAADAADEVGFWMADGLLELWLCLLALHIRNTSDDGGLAARIRDQWLLAARIGCVGSVPHGLEDATESDAGLELVRQAVRALDNALQAMSGPLPPQALNLLIAGSRWTNDVEPGQLGEIAAEFLDLLDFKVVSTAGTRRSMPGSRREGPMH